jgi:hypothetical protein
MMRVVTPTLVYLFITYGVIHHNVIAAPAANDMQTCQAMMDIVEDKLTQTPNLYAEADIDKVKKGLQLYNQFIQDELIDPTVIYLSNGDQSKIQNMKQQLLEHKMAVVQKFQARYPQAKLNTDQVIAINNCAKKAMPKGEVLQSLKISLTTMLALARQ